MGRSTEPGTTETVARAARAPRGSHRSAETRDAAGDPVLHAVSDEDATVTLCGEDVIEVVLLPHGDPAQRQPLIFEDGNDHYHCDTCHEPLGSPRDVVWVPVGHLVQSRRVRRRRNRAGVAHLPADGIGVVVEAGSRVTDRHVMAVRSPIAYSRAA